MIYSVSSGRLYTGIAKDPQRRLAEHNGKNRRGAKATRYGRPWQLVYTERYDTKGQALQREHVIKSFPKTEKLLLCGLSA